MLGARLDVDEESPTLEVPRASFGLCIVSKFSRVGHVLSSLVYKSVAAVEGSQSIMRAGKALMIHQSHLAANHVSPCIPPQALSALVMKTPGPDM